MDVFEAIEDTTRHFRIDPERTYVRGFSMGGAACWQFATHYSDRWFAANPGAGFAETPRFLESFQQETLIPTAWQRKLWNLYDCDKYALNLFHCPTIAYSGELDKQKQAADVMAEAMARHHALIMVYPNPLNPNRYVVLNSSFTFRDYAYLNNARQVPMLPDWAVIDLNTPAGNIDPSKVDPGKVVAADFFDESWRLK